jgi:alpha-mannosidase II
MNDLYRDLPFDDYDGGVWKQGWDIDYLQSDYDANHPLEVFVVC